MELFSISVHVSWIETEPCSRQWHIYFKFRRVLETLGFFLSKCMFCGGICAEAPILWIASTNHIHQTGTDILKSPLWSPKDLKSSLPLEKETKIQQWNWNSTNRRVKVIAVNTRTQTHTLVSSWRITKMSFLSLFRRMYMFLLLLDSYETFKCLKRPRFKSQRSDPCHKDPIQAILFGQINEKFIIYCYKFFQLIACLC